MRRIDLIAMDLIFPKRCMFCNDLSQYPDFICSGCIKDYPLRYEEVCHRCSKPQESCICQDLSSSVYKMLSACFYEGAAITCIKKFKEDKDSFLGDNFAELLESVLNDFEYKDSFPFITYIPMEREKIESRGHNMAETLAFKLSQRTGKKLIAPPIEKIYTENFQHDLNRKGRFKNAALSFIDKEEQVSGNIILVDDVITTGATITRAADILVKNGADRVLALSIATTKKRERQ